MTINTGGGYRNPPPPRVTVNNYGGGYSSPRTYNSGRRRSSAGAWVFLSILAILLLFVVIAGVSNRSHRETSSYSREKLESVPGYRNDNVIDELDWLENPSRVSSRLVSFYEKTGVQPFIMLKAYDGVNTTSAKQEEWTADYFDNQIGMSNGFLLVYFEEEDPDVLGNVVYWYGSRVTSVMDAEATQIFLGYLDNYWDTDMSADDLFVRTFTSTADTIMQRSKTVSDIVFVLLSIVLVIAIGVTVVCIIFAKRKAERERAEETERILSKPIQATPLGSSEADAIMDKYKD